MGRAWSNFSKSSQTLCILWLVFFSLLRRFPQSYQPAQQWAHTEGTFGGLRANSSNFANVFFHFQAKISGVSANRFGASATTLLPTSFPGHSPLGPLHFIHLHYLEIPEQDRICTCVVELMGKASTRWQWFTTAMRGYSHVYLLAHFSIAIQRCTLTMSTHQVGATAEVKQIQGVHHNKCGLLRSLSLIPVSMSMWMHVISWIHSPNLYDRFQYILIHLS